MSRKTGKRKLEAIQSNTTDDILREVLNAFDGSRSDIGNTMKEFLEKNLPLKPQDLNRLLNAFIIDRNNPLAVEMGLSSNVPEPRAKKNQPVVDNLNWSQQFLSQYKGMFNDPVVDKILVVLFVQSYKLTAELSNYLSQNETENLKALRLILDSLTQDNSSKESVDAIFRMIMNRKKRKVAIVAGSGVSAAVVEPQHKKTMIWKNLIKLLLEDVQSFIGKPLDNINADDDSNLNTISDMIVDFLKDSHSPIDVHAFAHQLYRSIRPAKKSTDLSDLPLCEAIHALDAPIASTNYDTLLEDCLDRHFINVPNHKFDKDDKLFKYYDKLIYHLHGVYSEPGSFVLGASEFKKRLLSFLEALLHFVELRKECRSLLFIGCGKGMFDEHFLAAFRIMEFLCPETPHFALVKESDLVDLDESKEKAGIKNLFFLSYGSEYDDLPGYIWNLARKTEYYCTELFSITENKSAVCEKIHFNDSGELEYVRQKCSYIRAMRNLYDMHMFFFYGKNSGFKVRILSSDANMTWPTVRHHQGS